MHTLEKLLASEEYKKDPKAALEAFMKEQTEGLLSKRDELLGELKKVKGKKNESDSELERLKKLEESVKIQQEEDKSNYQEALKLQKERHQKELGSLKESNDKMSQRLSELQIDGGLSSALDSVRVHPDMKEAVTALLKQKVELKDDGAYIEDKALSDYITEWSGSDSAKPFLQAKDNSGGGAGGSNNRGGASNEEMTTEEFLESQLKG